MDDRNSRYGQRDYGRDRDPSDYGQDYGSGRDYSYSSARDYAASGEYDQGRGDRSRYGAGARGYGERGGNEGGGYRGEPAYGRGNYAFGSQGGQDRDYRFGARSGGERSQDDRGRGYGGSQGGDRGYGPGANQDRGFFDRAGDEVRSWFGDEEAERRREADQRYDAQAGRSERWRDADRHDEHYGSWRRERIAELDRDYDEYRRENAQRFHNEFTSWRSERQGQRDSLGKAVEHMEVVGSDGSHVGTVDKVRGDRIILTKNDSDAGGHHHSIPSRWIQSVDDKVTLRKTAEEAEAHWKDEERSGAMFGQDGGKDADDHNWRSDRNLGRSFSGTY